MSRKSGYRFSDKDMRKIRAHVPEKWVPVFRLREAWVPFCRVGRCFGGRRQVRQGHAHKATAPNVIDVRGLLHCD
jgi:hypothetical protein